MAEVWAKVHKMVKEVVDASFGPLTTMTMRTIDAEAQFDEFGDLIDETVWEVKVKQVGKPSDDDIYSRWVICHLAVKSKMNQEPPELISVATSIGGESSSQTVRAYNEKRIKRLIFGALTFPFSSERFKYPLDEIEQWTDEELGTETPAEEDEGPKCPCGQRQTLVAEPYEGNIYSVCCNCGRTVERA
jgi:hypothetical protein